MSFAVHLLLFQLIDHNIHRVQHNLRWRRQLHALHLRQRQMMLWLDSRTHLLDDLLYDSLFFVSGLLLGVGRVQFVARMACKKLVESLLHANLRMNFGPVLGRLLVSPQFHRLRHATACITPSAWAMNCALRAAWVGYNCAALFPVWGLLFRSARWDEAYPATGVRDQWQGRSHGRGFWARQWLGLKRLARS